MHGLGKVVWFQTTSLIYDAVAKSVQGFGERPIPFAYKSDPEALGILNNPGDHLLLITI